MSQVLLQLISAISGAGIGAIAVVYVSRQTHRQNEVVAMLQTLQGDNKDLRDENRSLREELEDCRDKEKAHGVQRK